MDVSTVFKNYDHFLKAFIEYHSTEFYGDVCPEYRKMNDTHGEHNQLYITYFLENGLDPQEGLSKFIDALAECSRYGYDCDYDEEINLFISKGASLKPLTASLMATYDSSELEDFNGRLMMRMKIADSFWDDLDHDYIQSLTDWASIKPKYWEYLVFDYEYDNGKEIEKTDNIPESLWCYSYMKYCTNKL
jgi:hypothetical protein